MMGEPKAKKQRHHQLALGVQPQVPRFPFVNSFFNVSVYLFDEGNQVKGGDEFEFPLHVRLLLDDKQRTLIDRPDALEINPPMPHMTRAGKTSFQVRIKHVSMDYDNRDFLLHISASGKAARFNIAPIITDPMTVIRYRLRIRPESQPPAVWYKDEGGRDKCIELTVDLVDCEGRRVQGQAEVPVKVTLLYEDLHSVSKQDILKLSADSTHSVDESGSATLRLRIEDVSKNHQSKGFIIKVGPDTNLSPMCADISPDISTSISVRSKRNRRTRHGGRMEDDVTLVGHALSRSMGPSMDLAGSMPLAGNPLVEAGPLPTPDQKGVVDTSAPVIKALSNVISWTRTVVNGLYQIQWQLIGYESKPDGTPDVNRPLFNIHNPNTIVTNILQAYRSETMDHLRYLVQALEMGNGGQPQPSTPNGGPYGMVPGGSGALYGAQGPTFADGPIDSTGSIYQKSMPGGLTSAQSTDDLSEPPTLATAFGGAAATEPVFSTSHSHDHGEMPVYSSAASSAPSTYVQHAETTAPTDSLVANGFPQPPGSPTPPPGPPAFPRPGLGRGRSGVFEGGYMGTSECGMGMVPLVRESTYDLLAAMDPSWFGIEQQQDTPPVVLEAQVQCVVAKVYFSNAFGELGFPAFDQKHVLLGFYREGRNDQGQTVACYVPLPPGFTDAEKRGVSEMLKQEMQRSSGAVVSIVNDDLTQLKERVLTFHWSRSQGFPTGDVSPEVAAQAPL